MDDQAGPGDNASPTTQITSPAHGSVLQTGSAVVVSAAAADRDGSIESVEFLEGSTTRGVVSSPPRQQSWIPALCTHALTVVAIDGQGARTTSAVVHIRVVDDGRGPRSGEWTYDLTRNYDAGCVENYQGHD